MEVVEVKEDGQRVHLAAGHLHSVGLVIVGPVAEVAHALGGEKAGGAGRFRVAGAHPAGGTAAGGVLQCGQGTPDVVALLLFGHLAGDETGGGLAVANEFPAAVLALLDEEGVVGGDGGVHGDCGRDAEPIEQVHDAEDSDAVAVLAL